MTKILIVEDEIITALGIQEHLERLGYTVPTIACSGEEAVTAAAETQPDLILMDIRLKGEKDPRSVRCPHRFSDRSCR